MVFFFVSIIFLVTFMGKKTGKWEIGLKLLWEW